MRGSRSIGTAIAALAIGVSLAALSRPAQALESGGMLMHAINPGGTTISRKQFDRYVDKRFDILAGGRHAKTISRLQLGGRMPAQGFKTADTKPMADPTLLSRAEYKAYADALFAQANIDAKKGSSRSRGSLNANDLKSAAGRKLIRLLE